MPSVATIHALGDLRGKTVATLAGTIAYDILLRASSDYGVKVASYEDDVHPFSDLAIGRVDAVLLDNVLAERRHRTIRGFTILPQSVAIGHYVGVLAPQNAALRDRMNDILKTAMRDGTLEQIFRKWSVWNEDQPALYARLLAGTPVPAVTGLDPAATTAAAPPSGWDAAKQYFPSLLRASAVTIVLSCLSMALAVGLGVVIATGRVYGGRLTRVGLTSYVELIRGTPILLQLFVLYYGLAAAVRLPAFVAALLGLALNYAAYESEIYRSALEAISAGQLEAARTLGLSEGQVLRLVRAPQAFRLALAPMTNDFIALLKDSSLVSVLTVLELTKQTQIFATNLGSWVVPGLLCAGLYLAMSLPLAALARRLEQQWKDADTMTSITPPVVRVDDVHLRRGARPILTGVSFDAARGRAGRDHGTVRIRKDHDTASRRGTRTVRRRPNRRGRSDPGRRCAGFAGNAPRAATQGRHGLSVSLPVRTSVGAEERVPGACPRACHGARGCRATSATSCCQRLASNIGPRRCRASCRAARLNGSRSRARWPSIRRSC